MRADAFLRTPKSHLELTEEFRAFDRNADGAIDRSEFSQFVRHLDEQIDAREILLGFDVMDADHDGLIEFREFIAWWRAQ